MFLISNHVFDRLFFLLCHRMVGCYDSCLGFPRFLLLLPPLKPSSVHAEFGRGVLIAKSVSMRFFDGIHECKAFSHIPELHSIERALDSNSSLFFSRLCSTRRPLIAFSFS